MGDRLRPVNRAANGTEEMSMKAAANSNSMPSAVDGGTHQSIARIDLLLSALAENPEQGLRLAEVCRATGLGKATAHRLLSGLVAYKLADYDAEAGRYTVGFKVFAWASGVQNRYGLAELARPGLERLVERFHDAVYLSIRRGDEAVCVERLEGSFPIKTLAFKVGDHRPLGVGAGAAAILAALPLDEQRRVLAATVKGRAAYRCSDAELAEILQSARRGGYAFVDGKVVPGICTVGVAILLDDGTPIGAISVSAIGERMHLRRRKEIAAAITDEIRAIVRDNGPFLRAANRSRLIAALPA
jgi:DNA-binding IclR family transcriptional regulator